MHDLQAALAHVALAARETPDDEEWIDTILTQERPTKRLRPLPDKLTTQLERDYLTPPTKFSTDWLNKLQTYDTLISAARDR